MRLVDELCDHITRSCYDLVSGYDKSFVGLQISGGLDSAIIQACLKIDNLVCCSWPDTDNNSLAIVAALGKDVRKVSFSRQDMINILPRVKKLTGGKGTWSNVCHWFLDNELKKMGCSIVLNGEGSDEIFWGYSRYKILYYLSKTYKDKNLEEYRGITDYLFGSPNDVLVKLLSRNMNLDDAVFEAEYADWTRGLVGAMASVEERFGLTELLGFENAIALDNGLKHLWPFRDDALIAFSKRIPADLLINEKGCKLLLREAALKLGVPSVIVNEQTKKGLFIPQSWRPDNDPMWSRKWFDELMANA